MVNFTNIKLSDVIDAPALQEMMDHYFALTGIGVGIIDLNGTVLVGTGWQDICVKFHRAHPESCQFCHESDIFLSSGVAPGTFKAYRCKNNMWDIASPIMLGDIHIGNIFLGQFLYDNEVPDYNLFSTQAKLFGFNEAEYIAALDRVPRWSQETVNTAMSYYSKLALMISKSNYNNAVLKQELADRKLAEEELLSLKNRLQDQNEELQVNEEELRCQNDELQSAEEMLRLQINEYDISQKQLKARDESLSRQNTLFASLLKILPIGVFMVEAPSGKPLVANEAAHNLLGRGILPDASKENLSEVYKAFKAGTRDPYPPEEMPVVLGINGVTSHIDDMEIERPNGTKTLLEIFGAPVTDDEGTIWASLVSFIDITERKRAEAELNNMTERLKLATSSAKLGIWDWNVKDNVMVWDDRMFELYGITKEAFPNSIDAWLNGLHPQDKESTIADCQAALHGEKEFDTQFRVLHPDGTVKYLSGKGLVIRGTDGAAERMIGINYDSTDSKRAEEEKLKLESQLQQAQKLESVGRLAGGVAHDFNNMLSVIMGHSEMGLMRLEATHPVCVDLNEIRKTADRSADLTRQLLAFARKQTIVPKVIDLNDTVTCMLKMLQRLIGEDIILTWQPSSDQCQIKMDPSQIDQILANLCVNARDAVEAIEGIGRIIIETGDCRVDANYCASNFEALPGDYVRLVISDNGVGMDSETRSHIFEPFYTTKEPGKGTGLGLATVYGIVKQNNGFINIYSEPSKGTTFSIHLPRYQEKGIQKQTENSLRSAPRGQETILLVEDETTILDITAVMLESQGYTVLKADAPSKAMDLAREHSGEIHLLMTDVILPEINGRDLSQSILTINPGMKCLFMSGYTADAISHHGVLDEGVHFIQKPFSLPNMAAIVRDVLDGEKSNT